MPPSLPLILLVDSDRQTHELLQELLADEDCKFVGARTLAAAKRVAVQLPPDILVLDAATVGPVPAFVESLGLPKGDPRLLLLAAAGTSAPDVARLAALGPVLPKPVAPDRLRHTIHTLIELCVVQGELPGAPLHSAPSEVWRRLTTARLKLQTGGGSKGLS